jgi:hypothetical protein
MLKFYIKFVAACIIYAAFAVYLYQPHFAKFGVLQYLLPVNLCFGAIGCFVLSRRWVSAFAGSFFAGAIYGFGPFMLGLSKFHPTAGFLAASIPWLFCPAAFGQKGKWQWVNWPLAALPFVVIVLFFFVSAHYRLFAVPIQAKLHLYDLTGLLIPLAMAQGRSNFFGFYHVPIAALVMGFAMLVTVRRLGIIVIFCLGAILVFFEPFYGISPVMWLTIPILCCSVLIGVGKQGLALAGYSDRKWILLAAAVSVTLAIVILLLATKYFQVFAGLGNKAARLITTSAKIYILGTIIVLVIFLLARAKLRFSWLRWILLCSTMAVDIFFSATFIVDKVL